MVTVDASELKKLGADAQHAPEITRAQAREAVREASFAVEKRVKIEMPVDTGRARASWGHWQAGDLFSPNKDAGPDDALWEEQDDGLTIVQGSNVPYIEMLNNGHSRQAPAGFLDAAQLTGQVELEKEVRAIDPLDPNLQWLAYA